MQRQTVIVYTPKDGTPECFTNFKLMCEAKGLPYNTLKSKPMPLDVEGATVYRVKFIDKTYFELYYHY